MRLFPPEIVLEQIRSKAAGDIFPTHKVTAWAGGTMNVVAKSDALVTQDVMGEDTIVGALGGEAGVAVLAHSLSS